jgi:hypothetical protein
VSAGSVSRRRRKCSSSRPGRPIEWGTRKPPASSAAVIPFGNSSNANGFPRVSPTIRSRTSASMGPGMAAPRRARASSTVRPDSVSTGNPASWRSSLGSRIEKTISTDSARSRRATNPKTWLEAASSHCVSSTTHSSGRFSATSANKLSVASATRNRSGGSPDVRPNATRSAAC